MRELVSNSFRARSVSFVDIKSALRKHFKSGFITMTVWLWNCSLLNLLRYIQAVMLLATAAIRLLVF